MIPRFFVDSSAWNNPVVRLSRDDSHHLTDVLRLGMADRVVVSDGIGGEASAEVIEITPGGVAIRILDRRPQTGSGVMITLIQAVPKAQKMDWIIQKATEIGVWSILPVMTDRGVVKLEEERADKRTERWQRIAVEAAKQCRTAWIPTIQPVRSLVDVLGGGIPLDGLLIASLEETATPFRSGLADLRARHPKSVGLLIGPEGDFSPREFALAHQVGAIPVSYGTRVLRVETAAIYGLCVLSYELAGS
ncbi:MAG: 16S rRNA (uracil(1498)-N(3))-methyltransferase [bacterium]